MSFLLTMVMCMAAMLLIGAVSCGNAGGSPAGGWRADPEAIKVAPKHGPVNYEETHVPAYRLPDPLLGATGRRVGNASEWETAARPRTLELYRSQMFGRAPGSLKTSFDVLQTEPAAIDGRATHKRVRITTRDDAGKTYAFEASVITPNGAGRPAPCFLLINNRPPEIADPWRKSKNEFWPVETLLERGYATAVFRTWDVDPDENGDAARARGVRGVWPAGGATPGAKDAWGTIAAWAWGASRVMDFLQTEPAIDAGRVALIGHSRGGKTALWAAAQDPRFAMSVSNNSGCGGAAIARRRFGETIERINGFFPYWFCDNYKAYGGREDELPFDQHQLLSLVAPRALAVGSADVDFWADPRGEFLGLAHASDVYGLYGQPAMHENEMPALSTPLNRGARHYHIRPGGHGLNAYDWACYMDFADQTLRAK